MGFSVGNSDMYVTNQILDGTTQLPTHKQFIAGESASPMRVVTVENRLFQLETCSI